MKSKSLLFALFFVLAMVAKATTYYVRSIGGSDTNDGLSSGSPFLTLGKAFDLPALADGDVIDISGTFTYATSKNLTKSITIQGTDKSTAIVEGIAGAYKNCFIFGGVNSSTGLPTSTPVITIENVTFQNFDNLNALGNAGNGGAFFVQVGVTLTCRNLNFINNQAYSGGAIRAFGGVLTFEDCFFKNNRAKRINGLYSDGGVFNFQIAATMGSPAVPNTNNLSVVIDRCLFEGNTSDRYGAALSFITQIPGSVVPGILVQNSTFTGNEVTVRGDLNSGTIYIQESTQNAEVKLINNTIAYNSSKISTSNATAGIYILNTSSANKFTLINNIIFSNYNAEATPKSIAIKTGQPLPLTESRNNIIDYNFNFTTNTTNGATMASDNVSSVTSGQLLLAENLANNGGTTKTLSLGASSAAVNAGYVTGVPIVDQRIVPREGTPDVGAFEYVTPTTIATSEAASFLGLTSGSIVTVLNGGTLSIDEPTTIHSLTIERGGKVTNNSGQTLETSTFTINSDVNGTGTYVDNGTTSISGSVNVNQYLTGLTGNSNRAWWYLSSPVTVATAAVFNVEGGINKMTSYDETVPGYLAQFNSNAAALSPGVGYVAYIGGGDATYTFSSSTGAATAKLNTGAISVPVTRTGTTAAKRGFNLIGNPYPSYLDWNQMDTLNVLSTIWYRSYSSSGAAMVFDIYNGKSGIAINNSNNNNTLSQFIPPMQAFWVKVRSEKPDLSGLAVDFTNAMRSNQGSDVAGLLRSPKLSDQKVLRLQVSNGINSDQAVILINANASDGFDDYDSPKLSNENAIIPEIYTFAGIEKVAINGQNSITPNQELPLGFATGTSNNFTIRATEVNNFDFSTKIILKDNLLNTELDITGGTPYNFSSDVANTTSRFTVIFKSDTEVSGISNNANDIQGVIVFKNANNQIVINHANKIEKEGTVTVSNALGQKLISTSTSGTNTLINKSFSTGVYFVSLVADGNKITKKIIIN
jgi:hypothetical protein